MKITKNLFTLALAACLFTIVSCEQDNRQEQTENFRDDYRDWEEEYLDRNNNLEATRGPVMRWHETFKHDVTPEPRTVGGVTEVPAITDTLGKDQLVPRIAELNDKHEAIRTEHQALIEKHRSFINRDDLTRMSDDEWDNHKDLIRSDQDRMENDLDELENQWEEVRGYVEDVSAPSERTGARTAPAPTVDPRTTTTPNPDRRNP